MVRWFWVVVLVGCGRINFDAPEDADVGSANVLTNPGCEGSVAPWFGYFATVMLGTPAHSGATSCEMCRVAGSTVSTLDPMTGINDVAAPAAGTMWRAYAWVRAPAGTTGLRSRMNIREWLPGGVSGIITQPPIVDVSDTDWAFVEATHTVSDPTLEFLDAYVDLIGQVGDCMLVDDLWFGPAL